MTILDADIVDLLGIEEETGYIVLTMVDDLDWSNEREHLKALEDKVNRYLHFIQSGQVFQYLEEKTGRSFSISTPVKVLIQALYPVPGEYWKHLDYIKAELFSEGIGMEWNLVEQTSGQDGPGVLM